MKTEHVVVKPYNDRWPLEFAKIQTFLKKNIGYLSLRIEHVGSTAIPGLSAKPIIDIDVVISDYTNFEELKQHLFTLGYIYEGTLGIPDRHAFKYNPASSTLFLHHLYVCPLYSKELLKHLFFRDYLRQHPLACKRYGMIKQEAATLFPNDIERYIAYKKDFIISIYQQMHS
ncbi:GrpB family protein [Liquorilactobacillus capillatus]|uniref:GrpB family protein n=1 Tax=Liquorilactobacillus capillatus DSM 19910 TaxID=1423731 RepID=A0A0R1LZR1_9LACO|nr:GrpB family protein [Liquorilactobacillus capillatus]KRL01127.1 hypothetical protein FC81_GL001266 [Liquorilactobacillus capillatus DSM 19910]